MNFLGLEYNCSKYLLSNENEDDVFYGSAVSLDKVNLRKNWLYYINLILILIFK